LDLSLVVYVYNVSGALFVIFLCVHALQESVNASMFICCIIFYFVVFQIFKDTKINKILRDINFTTLR
jgi:hypothetical protein